MFKKKKPEKPSLSNSSLTIIKKKDSPPFSNILDNNLDNPTNSNATKIFYWDISDEISQIDLINKEDKSFVNASIQCLANLNQLTKFFLSEFVYDNNNEKQILSNGYYELLKNLNLDDLNNIKNVPNSTDNFIKTIYELNISFSTNPQNESRDFIKFFLKTMHNELNKSIYNDLNIFNKDYYADIPKTKEGALKKFFNNYKNKNNSKITNFFSGINEINFKCKYCNNCIYDYELFNYFDFNLNNISIFKKQNKLNQNNDNEYIDIYDCFRYKKEKIYNTPIICKQCNKCNKIASITIFSMSNYLIIFLNREKGSNFKVKINETLNLKDYIIHNEIGYILELYGIVLKITNSNHYFSYCYQKSENK